MIKINIAADYTKTPGSRLRSEGEYSGEDFREKYLIPAYEEATQKAECIEINLDGGYGYATSFLEEAFGGMARYLKNKEFINMITFISEDEPSLVDEIKEYVKNAEV
jgi:hypothetical protein